MVLEKIWPYAADSDLPDPIVVGGDGQIGPSTLGRFLPMCSRA